MGPCSQLPCQWNCTVCCHLGLIHKRDANTSASKRKGVDFLNTNAEARNKVLVFASYRCGPRACKCKYKRKVKMFGRYPLDCTACVNQLLDF